MKRKIQKVLGRTGNYYEGIKTYEVCTDERDCTGQWIYRPVYGQSQWRICQSISPASPSYESVLRISFCFRTGWSSWMHRERYPSCIEILEKRRTARLSGWHSGWSDSAKYGPFIRTNFRITRCTVRLYDCVRSIYDKSDGLPCWFCRSPCFCGSGIYNKYTAVP